MRFLLTLSLLGWLATASADSIRLLIQRSPLAGSQYYALDACWSRIRVGDRLDLIREPDNRHDRQAIRVEWQGHQLGYVPRRENRVIAGAMDAGEPLSARVSSISDNENPWQRVAFEVFIEL
ncbi:MAG: HIRAN domain-containing protein [Azonexus sp.]